MKTNTILLISLIVVLTAVFAYRYSVPKYYPVITQTAESNPLSFLPGNSDEINGTKAGKYANLPEITTIEQVFTQQKTIEDRSGVVSLFATGDVLLARSINYKMVQLNDFTWPFIYTADYLKTADLVFINLETPLISDCPTRIDGMFFCGDLRGIQSLQFAGIDVVNLANNHASNFGAEGVAETDQALRASNFTVSGIDGNNAGFKTVKDTRFAFLGYNEVNEQAGITKALDETIQSEVAAAKAQADIVVVQFHWGNEYTYSPSENQKRLAHLTVDAGADLIIGNHPHWYQPIEFYNGKLITYSHGNFIFDQMWSRETREGVVGEYLFVDKKLVGVQFTPVLIENYGQPKLLEGEAATKILNTLETESRKILN